jgi:hypothetical protein
MEERGMTPGGPDGEPTTGSAATPARLLIFGAVCLVAVCVVSLALVAAGRADDRASAGTAPPTVAAESSGDVLGEAPVLVFESTALGEDFGRLATVALDEPDGPRRLTDLDCERVDVRSGHGVCLRSDRGFLTTYEAVGFDESFVETFTLPLSGTPSRVRMAPSGDVAGVTVFVTGHSYAQAGFSTQTTLIDIDAATVIADLEVDFEVMRDGSVWREIDFNFWGVTFIDDGAFYATLGTGGNTYLVRGDVATRRMEVVTSGVECPSLSPDGTRVAYKVRSDRGIGPVTWRMAVMDLATMQITELAETANVDDQVGWLNDGTVIYGLPRDGSPAETDMWSVAADGSGEPSLLVPHAWSAVVVPST